MKNLPVITILLWLLMIFLYKFYPAYVFKDVVQYPLIVLLSTLLPVSFWLKIQSRQKLYAFVLIVIFFINSALLVFALGRNYAAQGILERSYQKGIMPQIAELLTLDKNDQKRHIAAQIIFQQHSVQMPYRASGDSFVLYQPSDSDKKKFRANSLKNAEIQTSLMNATEQVMTCFFFLCLHAGIFLIVLLFLIIYEHKGRSSLH